MNLGKRRNLSVLSERNLRRKYVLLFKNSLQFEGFEYGVADYFMNKLLSGGTVAAFKLDSKGLEGENWMGLGSFSSHSFDWKGTPINIKIVNEYNNKLIPKDFLKVDTDAVILDLGFVPISFINEYVQRVCDIQATIDTNLVVHKMPFVIKSSDPKTIAAIKRILENEPIVSVDDDMFDVKETKVPYIIDKLTLYKSEVEGELLSLLGIDNVKFEKKAQMTVDEVTSNDDEIVAYRNIIKERINAFFGKIKETLGFDLSIKEPEKENIEQEEEEEYDVL